MSPPDLVVVHVRARRAWPFLPTAAPAHTIWLGDLGELVVVKPDGTADELGEDRRGGAAADPCARPVRGRG